MQIQLIQKKAQIGSQVEFTLMTGNQVSGLLKEMSLEHVTLDAAKGEMTILAESIIGVQSLNDINAVESLSNTPALDNQINTSESSNSESNKFEVKDSTDSSLNQVEASDDADANKESTDPVPGEVEASDDKDANPESTAPLPKEVEVSDDTDLNAKSIASINLEEQVSEKLSEIEKQYSTRTGEQLQTPVQNLSIHLSSKDEFKTIKNPYAQYAEGNIVGDANMFYGREELIQNIAQAIQESRTQSKCVLVFGQKRSGKSSVLYHLKKSLEKDRESLILDLGNMSTLLDQHAQTSLLHQFLNGILRGLERAIRLKQREGFSSLALAIPTREFYDHPVPLQFFEDVFLRLKDLTDDQTGQEDWRGIRVVLLIDEFQYIYEPIIKGKIPDSFMQNWKALLQANYFSAVLVGQDVMPKFKLQFPNEFGTTQDERVTYLKAEDARKLIDEPIRIGGRQGESRYLEHAIERILDLTAGSPFYIQILCSRLVEHMNAKHTPRVTEAHVEQVKDELIRGVNAFDLDKFDNLINSGDTSTDAISDEDALKVLKTIADNSSIGPCHRDKIDCKTSLSVDTILDDLEKRDVVDRREQSYQIQVGLFKEWLVVNG